MPPRSPALSTCPRPNYRLHVGVVRSFSCALTPSPLPDRVDLAACAQHGIRVVRVPTYSPESVAEHALALMMALNRWAAAQRRIHRRRKGQVPAEGETLRGGRGRADAPWASGVEGGRG